ncbi:MAG: hypothetical protein ABIX28_01985 [Vicinamibacterales bacterium]
MSPYPATLVEIAERFCPSDHRKEIFRGFLAYRQALAGIGLDAGFQWLSGSFMEDIEALEGRLPGDVDVVTFCRRPAVARTDPDWQAFVTVNDALLDPDLIRASFRCHAFLVDMDLIPEAVISYSRYWYGLFAHRRGGLWKGLLEISLPVTADDADAAVLVHP